MKIPESLKLGGTIGFAAPSFGCNIEPYKTAFNNALKTFEKMGYKTKLGQNCYAGVDRFSNSCRVTGSCCCS